MKKNIYSFFILQILLFSLSSCLSLSKNSEGHESAETASADILPEESADEFADFESFDNGSSETTQEVASSDNQSGFDEFDLESSPTLENQNPQTAAPQDTVDQLLADTQNDIGQEQTQSPVETSAEAGQFQDEFQLFDEEASVTQDIATDNSTVTPSPAQDEFDLNLDEFEAPVATDTISEPLFEAPTEISTQSNANTMLAEPIGPKTEIKAVQFKANESGGTLIIQGDGPITFSTRKNEATNQLVLDIRNAILPDKFKRPLNMKDIQGPIGAIDAYQDAGSTTARFVVQLRSGSGNPFVVTEGSTLLVIADPAPAVAATLSTKEGQKDLSQISRAGLNEGSEKILTSRTLQEFLAGNDKFYGKKISLETNSMPVRDALRFISEEGGVNMIVADNIQGNVSLKLREVPWDQAFVVIMKAKDLGYVRQGSVLRVASLADLKKEEEDTIKLTTERLKVEPLVVKVFPINYAKVDDLAAKLKDFLTERGKATGDVRTNTIVITDIAENLNRISQLVQSLDTQPPQVLIEGRIIEATDSFQRQVGINWNFSGSEYILGRSNQGTIRVLPSLNIATGTTTASNLQLQFGTFDILGDLGAVLSMNELENKIRTLSSPRIVTLSNEKATINQKISIPIPSVQMTTTGPLNSFQFRDLELKLDVTPQITSNASVIMNISVKRELQGARINDQVSIESREASTKVMVKNGQTSVIGGVYQNDANDTVAGIPFLKDIPVLGSLFKSKNTDNRRTELMIFLTPRIVAAGFAPNEEVIKPSMGQAEGVSETK